MHRVLLVGPRDRFPVLLGVFKKISHETSFFSSTFVTSASASSFNTAGTAARRLGHGAREILRRLVKKSDPTSTATPSRRHVSRFRLRSLSPQDDRSKNAG